MFLSDSTAEQCREKICGGNKYPNVQYHHHGYPNYFSYIPGLICNAHFGSTIGLSVGAAAHYAFVISARYGFENTLIKNINPLAVIFNMSENRRSIVTSVIVMGVILFAVCVIFCTYVNRSDVSLNNKEILV